MPNCIKRNIIVPLGILAGFLLLGCGTETSELSHADENAMEHGGMFHDEADSEAHDHDHVSEQNDDEIHEHTDQYPETISGHADWEDIMDIQTARAEIRQLHVSIPVPGTIIPHPDHVAMVSPLIDSHINQVFANTGDHVKSGELLACLTSPDIGTLWAEYDRAAADLEIETQAYERTVRLYEEDILPERSREESERDLTVARLNHRSAYQRLRAIGIPEQEIELRTPCTHGGGASAVHLYSPIGGDITERNGARGEKIDPSHVLLQIIDIDPVWLRADVFVKDLTRIHNGDQVAIQVSAYDSVFTGRIFSIGDTVDETTKTVRIHAEFENADGMLKPGMFANAEVVIDTRTDALVIPREAVLDQGTHRSVFILEQEGYHRHDVITGIEQGGWVEILSGLAPGDRVVTTGNFQLASQSTMDSVDPHAGHNH